jgi:acetoin utilization deacetylase AcuC-like enzyme
LPAAGKVRSAGAGDGEGTTINVPLPGDSGHQAALMVFDAVIAPAARRFSPDVIIVSAGTTAAVAPQLLVDAPVVNTIAHATAMSRSS